jgi:hypothetical protein
VSLLSGGDAPAQLQEVALTGADEALDGCVAALCDADGQLFVAVGTQVLGLSGTAPQVKCAQRLTGHTFAVTALAPLSDGRLASAAPGELRIWRAASGELLRTVPENERPLCMLRTGASLWSAYRTQEELKLIEQDIKREKAAASTCRRFHYIILPRFIG